MTEEEGRPGALSFDDAAAKPPRKFSADDLTALATLLKEQPTVFLYVLDKERGGEKVRVELKKGKLMVGQVEITPENAARFVPTESTFQIINPASLRVSADQGPIKNPLHRAATDWSAYSLADAGQDVSLAGIRQGPPKDKGADNETARNLLNQQLAILFKGEPIWPGAEANSYCVFRVPAEGLAALRGYLKAANFKGEAGSAAHYASQIFKEDDQLKLVENAVHSSAGGHYTIIDKLSNDRGGGLGALVVDYEHNELILYSRKSAARTFR